MLVFNNQQRSGYDEIVSYGPKFYPSIKEMDAIYRFAGWTLDLMAADLEKLVSYQFLNYMDDEALTRFEKFLGIPYDGSKTIEERKTLAYANWSSSGKMSKTKIASIVNAFAECECTVSFENSVLNIDMVFKDDPTVYMDDIRELLRKTIPAHIEILYKGKVDTNIIFTWINKVSVDKIVNKIPFHLYRTVGGIMLDGSHFLDGTSLLNNTYSLFPVSDKHIFSVNNNENASFSVEISKNLHYLDGTNMLDGTLKLDSYYKKEDL